MELAVGGDPWGWTCRTCRTCRTPALLCSATHRHQCGQGHLHEPGHVQPESPVRAHQHHADEVAKLPGLSVPSHLVKGVGNLLALQRGISHAIRHQSERGFPRYVTHSSRKSLAIVAVHNYLIAGCHQVHGHPDHGDAAVVALRTKTVNGEFLILLSSFGDTLGSRAHQSDAHLEQGQAPVEKAKQELRESDVPKAVVNLGCKAVKRVK